jgi:hypothetical protein
VSLPICVTCGVQYGAPRDDCPVCEDPRQYVPVEGQQWTTLEALHADHANAIRPEGELIGVATEPRFAIGQRALVVPAGASNVLWDCITLLDNSTALALEELGGLSAIAISHPHYYSSMVEWAHRFECPVWLHADDRAWVMRDDPALQFWSGETHSLGNGLTLIRCGGHFAGGTVLQREGDLLTGDIVQVIPDRAWVSFMYSFPNYIPLPEAEIRSIEAALEPFAFERIYGAWWGTVIPRDGKGIVRRSAQRYVDALRGKLP